MISTLDEHRTFDQGPAPGRGHDLSQFSGDQQQAVFATWLAADPGGGVDVGARAEMYHLVRGLARAEKVVIVSSTDLTELVEPCDRGAVFQHGRIVDTLSGDGLSEQDLSLAMNAGFASPETGG